MGVKSIKINNLNLHTKIISYSTDENMIYPHENALIVMYISLVQG